VFKVTGSEVLTSSAGGKVDCWVMTTDYNRPNGKPPTFWLAKDSQVVVKVVSPGLVGGQGVAAGGDRGGVVGVADTGGGGGHGNS
jgi:hypothetical protein